MRELRQDRISGRWTIIAPQRGRRPFGRPAGCRSGAHSNLGAPCPFCPGHESELPGIISEIETTDAPGWRVRVVPNKFPAFQSDLPGHDLPVPVAPPDHRSHPAVGAHEVVIESPTHDADLTSLTKPELFAVTSVYRERCKRLLARSGIEAVILFRNRGSRAGASQDHPHSQIVALGLIPPRTKELVSAGLWHFREHGCCATCVELDVEQKDGRRVIEKNAHFLALVPFAAEYPFEIWIVPERHRASFSEVDDEELRDFTSLLGESLRRLAIATSNAPYRFVIETAPRSEVSAPYLHWRLRIVPQLVTEGGFELAADMAINPSCPEKDADILRKVGRIDEASE